VDDYLQAVLAVGGVINSLIAEICGTMRGVMGCHASRPTRPGTASLDEACSDSHLGSRLELGEFVFPQDTGFCLVEFGLIYDYAPALCPSSLEHFPEHLFLADP
jgi:hypothetical protein